MRRIERPPLTVVLLLAFLSFIVGALLFARGWWSGEGAGDVVQDLARARREMKLARYPQARAIADGIVQVDPGNVDARFVIAECFTKENRLEEALAVYEDLLATKPGDDPEQIAYQCAGEILLHQADIRRAEQYFREALKRDPYFPSAHNRLAFLLGLEGRRWESLPHLVELIKQDQFSVMHLLLLANPRQNIVIDDFLVQVKQRHPEDPLPRIAEAKAALERGDLDRVAGIVRRLLDHDPEQIEARMLEGALYLAQNDGERFVRWSQSLSLQHDSHPDAWLLRAQWARQGGDYPAAIRCCAEAFFRDPNNLEACHLLTQLLSQEQDDARTVEFFKDRTRLLERLEQSSHLLHVNQGDVNMMREAFTCCDWLERYWEAWGWCRAALAVDERLEWARTQKAEIEKHLVYDLPQTIIFRNINEWDYARYPLPEWGTPERADPGPEARGPASISFREISADLGLAFQYECGHQGDSDDPSAGRRMFEVPGGGVAAFDYDLDLYPDVYFTQGARHFRSSANALSDRLFRNQSGRSFEDVTAPSRIADFEYSHGVAAGDVNNDGFPDLYIGNLGINRLYVNNGDGTFSDATAGLPPLKALWTTSTAIADINRDGHPDLYDATYLKEEAWEQICEFDHGGRKYRRACNPRIFPAERDRIFLGKGDGTFTDRSDALPQDADDGRGLGILIADYFRSGALQLFIANDMSANNFYVLDPGSSPGALSFRDEALSRGVALDRRGRAQAYMGVAFGDLDGNRAFDLFVTTFYGDHKTLYLQEQEMFSDLSHPSNLAALSYQMLGFGTQTLDADLDGDLELFVANGHIDDFAYNSIPYRMRAQLFVNAGRGKFDELPPQQAGPYFARELLGRGVARLDWNRDGREDLLVSHLDAPNVLLSNDSETRGQALRLSFVGTRLARDAVGVDIELVDGEDVRIAQVTAGSGYLASNENLVVLTVLHPTPVVRVRWPGRDVIEFNDLRPGAHYRIIEGSPTARLMP